MAALTAAPAHATVQSGSGTIGDLRVPTRIGTLYRGDHFELSRYSPSGDWAEGYAMGHVNLRGWFC